ncbi:MAG: ferrous iron transport protein B, partial [Oscillospiraceae bacterium]
THPVFGLPIFFGVMLLVFALTFGSIGQWLSVMANLAISSATGAADALLAALDTAPLLRSLIIDGVFAGVGGVLSFMPTILVLFFLLSVLEDTGYMTRVAFLMDSLLRKIGLSGRSVVPLLIGFGCSVPAIMASRTLPGERDRKLTVLLVPFMSCSAKLPIYALVTDALFVRYKPLVLMSIYLLGMIIGVIYGLIFKNTVFKSEPAPFVLELPAYRLPTLRGVWLTIKRRAEDFLKKAFTVIFLATIIVWFLQRFDFSLAYVTDSSQSILASLGRAIAPALRPLGFGDWRIATALLTGITAKEAVVSTLGVLLASSGGETLTQALRAILTPLSAYSLLAFILLYMPCVAAMAAIRRELDSSLSALLAMLCQTALAWLVACLIYQGGLLFGLV